MFIYKKLGGFIYIYDDLINVAQVTQNIIFPSGDEYPETQGDIVTLNDWRTAEQSSELLRRLGLGADTYDTGQVVLALPSNLTWRAIGFTTDGYSVVRPILV